MFRVVRKGLTEKVTCEERPEDERKISCDNIKLDRTFKAEGSTHM